MSIKTEERLSRIAFVAAAVLAAGYMMAGCATGGHTSIPSGASLAANEAEAAGLDRGRKHYLMSCAECHRRYGPGERKPDEWEAILRRHKGRVSLTAEQFGSLENYILRASELSGGR